MFELTGFSHKEKPQKKVVRTGDFLSQGLAKETPVEKITCRHPFGEPSFNVHRSEILNNLFDESNNYERV